MGLEDKKVLVFGAGISGIGAVELLEKKGIVPILYDGNAKISKETLKEKLPKESEAEILIGELTEEILETVDLVILSPGVSKSLPIVKKIEEKNITIWGEIELAYYFEKGKVLAVTGTNGKTTTTALLGEIMKAHNSNTHVVGNIGVPYTSAVLETTKESITVVEVSSFQLDTIVDFHPMISGILNITPDHLDRHGTMENYQKAKENIAMKQTAEDTCVLNYDDIITRNIADKIDADVFYFSRKEILKRGVYLDQDKIVVVKNNNKEIVCSLAELPMPGSHNLENVMAAIAMAFSAGVSIEVIKKIVTSFQGVEHRIEFVKEINGVTYYNDSKGTNPDAAIKAVNAMKRPTILIGGGYDKKSDYKDWILSFDDKIKFLILLGDTKEAIANAAKSEGFTDIVMVKTLEEAVQKASELAKEDESVLLSPACASWDMFKSYEERGNLFKEYVMQLER